ncbi:MAG: hypothetical protein ABR508_10520 [Candidatus Baltobacteraceae bacterium]
MIGENRHHAPGQRRFYRKPRRRTSSSGRFWTSTKAKAARIVPWRGPGATIVDPLGTHGIIAMGLDRPRTRPSCRRSTTASLGCELAAMTPEWVGAISSLVTMVVIAGSVFAAITQVRHMRGSNQILALTELRETIENPAFQLKLREIYGNLAERLNEREFLQKVVSLPRINGLPELEAALVVGNFFENAGCLVKNRIIDATIFCDLWGDNVIGSWEALAPLVFARRITAGPGVYENFEYLAVLASEFKAKYPEGTYPKNLPRKPKPAGWTMD